MINKEFILLANKDDRQKVAGLLWHNYTVENNIIKFTQEAYNKWLDKECDEAKATAIIKEYDEKVKNYVQEMERKMGLETGEIPIKSNNKLKYYNELNGKFYEVEERTPEQISSGLIKYMSAYKSPDKLAKYKYLGKQFIALNGDIRAHFTDDNGYHYIITICEFKDYMDELREEE